MKTIIAVLTLVSSVSFAKTTSAQLAMVKNNLEVQSYISAFEKNRSLKCDDIKAEDVVVKKYGITEVTVVCNQYSEEGEAQANVHVIAITGTLYKSFFDLQMINVSGLE